VTRVRLADRSDIERARRIVVKVGSSSISGDNAGQIAPLVDALATAHGRGVEIMLVSSGAIATGMAISLPSIFTLRLRPSRFTATFWLSLILPLSIKRLTRPSSNRSRRSLAFRPLMATIRLDFSPARLLRSASDLELSLATTTWPPML
jgi:hypothetical protein